MTEARMDARMHDLGPRERDDEVSWHGRCPAVASLHAGQDGPLLLDEGLHCALARGHRGEHRARIAVSWDEQWPEADDPDETFDVEVDVQRTPCDDVPCSRPLGHAGQHYAQAVGRCEHWPLGKVQCLREAGHDGEHRPA